MQMNHLAFAHSPALRKSMKRGLARQAIASAQQTTPDVLGLIQMAGRFRPNEKSMARLAVRLQSRSGVIRVSKPPGGKVLTIVLRAVRDIEAQVEGEKVFQETGLIYLRATVRLTAIGVAFNLSAVSFCCHAMERLVERSKFSFDTPLLKQIDEEALTVFRAWDRAASIVDCQDEFYPSASNGVWAGGHDEMELDPDWQLVGGRGKMSIFSARTFLSPEEMRPTLYLRWKDDPTYQMN